MLKRLANTRKQIRKVVSNTVDETGDEVEESISGLVEAGSRGRRRVGLEPGVELLFAAFLATVGAGILAGPRVYVPFCDVLDVDERAGRVTEGYLGVVEEEVDGSCYLDCDCEVGLGKVSSSDSSASVVSFGWRWCVWQSCELGQEIGNGDGSCRVTTCSIVVHASFVEDDGLPIGEIRSKTAGR